MPRVNFTANLNRHVDCPVVDVEAVTLGQALEAVFRDNPRLRGYVLDDQNRVRKHITIFVDGRPICDHNDLSDPLEPASEVFVMQALSGGLMQRFSEGKVTDERCLSTDLVESAI